MERKKLLFLLVITAGLLAFGVLSQGFDHIAASQEDSDENSLSVFQALTLIENKPQEHMVVLGRYATSHEQALAQQLSAELNLRVKNEKDVKSRDGLLLVGTPHTNLLLDKIARDSFTTTEALVAVAGSNLLIQVSDDDQAARVGELLSDYKNNGIRLSPSKVTLRFEKTILLLVLLAVLMIPAVLVFTEGHRQNVLAKAMETTDEHKLLALEKYIEKYEDEGFSTKKMKQWLLNHGYEEQLIDTALTEVEHARTDLSP